MPRVLADAAPAPPVPNTPVLQPLSPADEKLLRDLDVLLDLDLLEAWDPTENLPIPIEDGAHEEPRP